MAADRPDTDTDKAGSPRRRVVVSIPWARSVVIDLTLRTVAASVARGASYDVVWVVEGEPTADDRAELAQLQSRFNDLEQACAMTVASRASAVREGAWAVITPATDLAEVMGFALRALDAGALPADLSLQLSAAEVAARLAPAVASGPQTQRRSLVAKTPGATYLGDGRVLVTTTNDVRVIASTRDIHLMPQLVHDKTYEPNFVAFLQSVLRPGDVVADVGANIGFFTVTMAASVGPRGRVYAFEPVPATLALLRDTIDANWFTERIVVRPVAVGAAAGEVEIVVDERLPALSQVRVEGASRFDERPETVVGIEVPLVSLDDEFVDDHLALVKIDVEGLEDSVFEGMTRLLDEERVDRVAFEFRDALFGDRLVAMVTLLERLVARGWRLCYLTTAGDPRPISLALMLEIGEWQQVVLESPRVTR